MNCEKSFLTRRVGDISQVAGLRRYTLLGGMASGVEAVDVRTGAGMEFTVLPGRGMDIAWASYKGAPISFISQTGITAPGYYDPTGNRWLRSFYGGLLTTCGLLNAGPPCDEEHPTLGVRNHGLHGRIANIPAENICVSEDWAGDEYRMTVRGRMREAGMFGEHLTLTRKISAKLSENRFFLEDVVENRGFSPSPLMLLYHCNFGYPLLDSDSELIIDSDVSPRDETAKKHIDEYLKIDPPKNGRPEEVFFHDLHPDDAGFASVALRNERLGFSVYLRYEKAALPCFTQWKQFGEGEYVLGLEPGNCNPVSQTGLRETGGLTMLAPGETRRFEIEFGVTE